MDMKDSTARAIKPVKRRIAVAVNADSLPGDGRDPRDIRAKEWGNPDTPTAFGQIKSLITDSETEMCKRLDELEVATVELLQLLTAPPDMSNPETATQLPVRLQTGFNRVEQMLRALHAQGQAAADPAMSDTLKTLSAQVDEVATLLRNPPQLRQDGPDIVAALQSSGNGVKAAVTDLAGGLESLSARLIALEEGMQARLEGLGNSPAPEFPQIPDHSSQLEQIENVLTELIPPQGEALTRLSAIDQAIGTLSERLANPADRDTIAGLLSPVETLLKRLDASVGSMRAAPAEAAAEVSAALSDRIDALVAPQSDAARNIAHMAQQIEAFTAREASQDMLEALRNDLIDGLLALGDKVDAQEVQKQSEKEALARLIAPFETLLQRLDRSVDTMRAAPLDAVTELSGELTSRIDALSKPHAETSRRIDTLTQHLEEFQIKLPTRDMLGELRGDLSESIAALNETVASQTVRRQAERDAIVKLLSPFETLLERMDSSIADMKVAPEEAAQQIASTLTDRLDALSAPQEKSIAQLDHLTQSVDSLAKADTMQEALTTLRRDLNDGIERLCTLVSGQDRRLKAEKQSLGHYLNAMQATFRRFDTATDRLARLGQEREAQDFNQFSTRLSAIEDALARLESRPPAGTDLHSPEALQDLSMTIADMLSQQDHPFAKLPQTAPN